MSDNTFSQYQRDAPRPSRGSGLIQSNYHGDEVPVQMDDPPKSTYDLDVQNAKRLKLVTLVLKILIFTLLILSGLGILSLIFKINLTPGKQANAAIYSFSPSENHHQQNNRHLQEGAGGY